MTTVFTFLNDANQQPAVYNDRPDLNAFTMTITTDSSTPIAVPTLRIGFPTRIFTLDQIAKITITSPGWGAPVVAGPYLTFTPTTAVTLVAGTPLVVKLSGVSSTNPAATTDTVQIFVGSQAPTAKLFLMRYPAAAGDLTRTVEVQFLPATVYRTPSTFDPVENVLTLRLTNLLHGAALVTQSWSGTPTVTLSFVYGNDIGSLTPADAPIVDPHSAYNIQVDVVATYKDGVRTYEWKATPPPPAASGTGGGDAPPAPSPVWTLQPVPENPQVLGSGAGATAEFRISGLSTSAPAGSTLAYLQFTDFPGYSDCYFAIPLAKDEPQPGIIYFDGVPNYVAAPGGTVTLSWQTLQMARVALQQDGNLLPGSFDVVHGSYSTTIDRSSNFALLAFTKATDTEPAHTAQWTAHVPDAQILTFTADAATVADGSQVMLSWTTRNALSGTIDTGSGVPYAIPKANLDSGSKAYFPRKPTTYTLRLVGQGNPPPGQVPVFVLDRGWASRGMGFSPGVGQGPVLFGTNAGLTLVGGSSENSIFQATDGVTWNQTGVANFPARYDAAGCSLGQTMWLTGGNHAGTATNDVWSSTDGVNWTQATAAAAWPRRSIHGCVAFNNKLWVIGGLDINFQPLADVWSSSDGITWTQATATAGWAARSGPAVAAFGGKLWLYGGLLADGSVNGDLWSSDDGATWKKSPSGGFSGPGARQRATLASPDGTSLYLFAGIDSSGQALDDFSLLDGNSWDLATGPSGWKVSRSGFTVWQGAFWFAGGMSGVAATDQVWSWFVPPSS